MLRRRLTVLAAIALLWPVATSAPSGGAVEPDLTVSATSGAARAVIEVSSASCVDDADGPIIRFLSARLVSGASGSEVLASAGSNGEGEAIRLAVPDWIDPADPAQIVAQCWELDLSVEVPEGDPPAVAVPFDPVAFDVLDPTEPAVQSAAFSRTALSTGQGFRVGVQGCFLEGSPRIAGTEVLTGTDLSGATGAYAIGDGAPIESGDGVEVSVLLNDSGTGFGWSITDGERPVIEEVDEWPSTIAPGSYVAFPYCAALSGEGVTYLYFPPAALEVTGSSPMDAIDLAATPGTRDVELAGECDHSTVSGTFDGLDIEAEGSGFLRSVGDGRGAGLVRPVLRPTVDATGTSGQRAISGDELTSTPFSTEVAADGSWRVPDEAAFDLGAVRAFATCGDPFAEGYSYDAQIAPIDVPPPPVDTTTTTTSTPTTTAPPPPPAQGVPGTPTYAG